MKKNIAFVVNPISGTTRRKNVAEIIRKNLDFSQFNACEIVITEQKGHGHELTLQFVEQQFDVVVAVGGDGTVNEVASALINSDTTLGLISTGSGNGLARHLKIPQNIKQAVEHLNFSEPINMDYGLVNGDKAFFCTCGFGFDAYVSELFSKSTKRGLMGYIEKMVTGYFNYATQPYQLKGKDIDLQGNAFVITFANASQWGYNAYIAPNASIQDGVMDISIITNMPIIAIPTIAFQLFAKTIKKDQLLITTLKANEITLYRDEPGLFHLDGDPHELGKEIHIKIVPNGLKVMVKKRF
ncbi:MAG TPA: YegS/Rv2252/BmrU family lipid kinase [Bacteroidales bacterium]|nr:YegS/Rv2252/BmrU family lipid kinase [Bacteroidales bacterium]